MAVLDSSQIVQEWTDGQSAVAVLYAMRGVSAGDTADLSGNFASVKLAVLVGTTNVISSVVDVAGTVVTMPDGLIADGAYLLAVGVHA
jgi:hypothetical protein